MAKSQLHFLGHVVDLLTVETVYSKGFNQFKGTPMLYNQGGLLKFVFDFEANFRFLERMNTVNYDLYKRGHPLDDGKIVFYDAKGDNLKEWYFKDAPIVFYEVKFDANGGGMRVEMIISPAIQNYGCKIHRSWHITPIKEETYQSPVYATVDNESKVLDYYLTDFDGNRIEKANIGENIFLNIETKNLIGKLLTITLNDKNVDFIYKDEILLNDTISDYKINNNLEKLNLEVTYQHA
ncbi:hypothetical protein J2Q11_13695 [Tenacibaculum finnmarkense genomovar finnmarkense]|uniref:type VI secretion system tube protein TssD n=1 Tax=Tenacibaculum finnmarkense TaxID=2781243 RepID=UPI001E50946F|nr:type VI secretion system tube protein TssD [Tenacibaculum finnmarkense]MCD8418778.1 hypothetical protein [Tenacibaculum finnmarkense genomovar finnmarkense]MCG8187078.1 hypothetical protein [Tenacibaculum finnmarkense genomovar finnmarkense]MCG8203625.1 hypothetical protein [Tenacibaculum finnmarkense genomovar finnmarkense]MCG8211117.1 hypothetical protein [Tenacibaculum finnmarkense genomovar finnmarkense]MCG8213872.1 hypothetical protein [Tenacibaculum finnmarkense genomovar finnmarkense